MDDINYNELFGLDEGVEEQEAAEPASETEESAGVNEQETAEPDVNAESTDTDTGSNTGDNGTDKGSPDGANKTQQKQSSEQNALYASIRRKAEAERDAAIAKARQDAQREMDEAIKSMGVKNPYTKQPISTKAELDAYRQQYAEEQAKRVKQQSGLNDADFDKFVEDLPQVQAAKAAEAKANKIIESNQLREAQLAAEAGIKAIQGYDPNIKTVQDLAKMPEYPQFYKYVQQGLSFEDAYVLTHKSAITQSSAAAARQTALNNAGKAHMTSTQSRGAGANVEVPREVMEQYKLFNPDATTAEIRAHYARNHK